MSIQQAQAFINKMKSDNVFCEAILSARDIRERLTIARREGVPCTIKDIESLQAVYIDPQVQNSNLPLSYQASGPCWGYCCGGYCSNYCNGKYKK